MRFSPIIVTFLLGVPFFFFSGFYLWVFFLPLFFQSLSMLLDFQFDRFRLFPPEAFFFYHSSPPGGQYSPPLPPDIALFAGETRSRSETLSQFRLVTIRVSQPPLLVSPPETMSVNWQFLDVLCFSFSLFLFLFSSPLPPTILSSSFLHFVRMHLLCMVEHTQKSTRLPFCPFSRVQPRSLPCLALPSFSAARSPWYVLSLFSSSRRFVGLLTSPSFHIKNSSFPFSSSFLFRSSGVAGDLTL